jgi:glycosyltransferase involved in cell wall biosynthesis
MGRTLMLVSTGAGWRTVGDRLEEAKAEAGDMSVDIARYTPSKMMRHLTWHTGYHSSTPAHVPLMDPFTANRVQFSLSRRSVDSYTSVVAATQAQAAAVAYAPGAPRVSVFLDATRNLYRTEFGAAHIKDAWIEREAELFRRVEHIFTLSQWAADDVVGSYGVHPSKVTVIPPMASVRAVPPGRAADGELLNVIFIGTDFERKGGLDLLGWQEEILHRHVRLTIVTSDNKHKRDVPNTVWAGPRSNSDLLDHVLPAADVICHPTYRDCSSIALAEAAMAGIPAVASNVAGVAELVVPGRTGFTFNAGDRDGFVNALLTLAADRSRLARMSEATREHALRTFSPARGYAAIQHAIRTPR